MCAKMTAVLEQLERGIAGAYFIRAFNLNQPIPEVLKCTCPSWPMALFPPSVSPFSFPPFLFPFLIIFFFSSSFLSSPVLSSILPSFPRVSFSFFSALL